MIKIVISFCNCNKKYINYYICVSDLSNDNPAPDNCALKPMSAINPFDEDSTPSG